MKRNTMIALALVLSAAATPAIVSARHGADDNQQNQNSSDVRREDRREDRQNDDTSANKSSNSNRNKVEDSPSHSSSSHDQSDDNSNVDHTSRSSSDDSDDSSFDDSSSDDNGSTNGTAVSRDEAIAIAKQTLPGKTLKKVEIEEEHGETMWSVRFTDGSRVDVSQADGAVTRTRDRAND